MGTQGVHKKGVLPWLVRCARHAETIDCYPALAALVGPVLQASLHYKIFFPHRTLFHFICPHAPGKLGRQSCRVAYVFGTDWIKDDLSYSLRSSFFTQVVFRGFHANDALQRMHDNAIQVKGPISWDYEKSQLEKVLTTGCLCVCIQGKQRSIDSLFLFWAERQRRHSIIAGGYIKYSFRLVFEWNLPPRATHWLAARWSGAAAHWSDQNIWDKIRFWPPVWNRIASLAAGSVGFSRSTAICKY